MDEARCTAWSPAGEALAVGGLKSVVYWSSDGARVLKGGIAYIYVVAFSPDGEMLGCGTESKTAKLLSRDGSEIAKLSGDSGIVSNISFDSRGKRVLAGRALWDTRGKALRRKKFAMDARFMTDSTIASAGVDYAEYVKNPALWILDPEGKEIAHEKIRAQMRELATDPKHVVIGYDDGHVSVHDAKAKTVGAFVRHESTHTTSSVAILGGRVASAGYGDDEVWVTDFDGKIEKKLPGFRPPTQGNGVAFARHAPLLAYVGGDRTIVANLENDTRVTLYSDGKSWLAVDERGRFQGSKKLSTGAKKEAPELLGSLFTSS